VAAGWQVTQAGGVDGPGAPACGWWQVAHASFGPWPRAAGAAWQLAHVDADGRTLPLWGSWQVAHARWPTGAVRAGSA